MADVVANRSKGSLAERCRTDAAKFGVMLLKLAQADASLVNHNFLDALIADAGNTEADFTNYARKTAITATLTQDDTNNRVDVDMPDQTWTAAGGASNNNVVKFVTFYEVAAADSTRQVGTLQDFTVTTDGSDVTAQINAAGFYRAS